MDQDNNNFFASLFGQQNDDYSQEAKEKWGHTEAFKQAEEKVKKLGIFGAIKVAREMDSIMKELAKNSDKGADHQDNQKQVHRLFETLKNFFEPTIELFRNLGEMYAKDQRFAAYFDKYQPGLATFLSHAIRIYCDRGGLKE